MPATDASTDAFLSFPSCAGNVKRSSDDRATIIGATPLRRGMACVRYHSFMNHLGSIHLGTDHGGSR